jgi:hypothetical protein
MFFNENTVRLMKEIVPEYISKNSNLCKLDKEKGTPHRDKKLKIVQP